MPSRHRNGFCLRGLWGTASLRLALIFSAIFGLGGALLVAGVDYGLFRLAEAEVRAGLGHQMAVMREDEARLGGPAMLAMLEANPRNHDARRYLLLVVTPDGQSFSNGLTPAAVNAQGFRRNLPTKNRGARWPDQRPDMLVLSHTTSDGTLLAVGRDIQHLEELRGGIRAYAVWSGLAVIALALATGLAAGYFFLRRLEAVDGAIARVVSGDASGRLPPIGFGREFDNLARHLNLMLDRQEAMLSTLKSVSEGIAHDLRTPLGRLRNRLDELAMDADDPEKRQTAIELAGQEIDQITALFESLLALARIESGAMADSVAPVDGAALLESVGEIYRPVIEDAGGALRIEFAGTPLMLSGNAHLLTQALSNLVENAIVHADGRPDIRLAAERRDGHLAFIVADRGPGIPAGERDKVVKRFYRMDRSRSHPGSGIGLAMCAAVAHWHGGELTLADNAPGLLATIELPAA